jgi:hypothetical protein
VFSICFKTLIEFCIKVEETHVWCLVGYGVAGKNGRNPDFENAQKKQL